jgi:hypothetical protein
MGWAINVDNDASWTTTISGTVEVGAAALDRGCVKTGHRRSRRISDADGAARAKPAWSQSPPPAFC